MTRATPFLGETDDRRRAFPGFASLDLTVIQDPWGHYTRNGQAQSRRYTLEDIPRHERCVNPRCQQGGLDLQQLAMFWPDGERTLPCNGHEGSPGGRGQGDPCGNWFTVTIHKTMEVD